MPPLVSVIIATYNSSKFIEEALDSVLAQTWKDVELIITDDSSRDNTVEICRNWLNKNNYRFTDVKLLLSERNTGIPANGNRGLRAARGEWIKFLGGDDALLPECLTDNIGFIEINPNIRILFSRINIYEEFFSPINFLVTTPNSHISRESIFWPSRTADSQYRMLLLEDRIHFSPSAFIHRDLITSLGGFNERFRLLEDYPLWLNLTKNGHKMYFMDKVTVNYRRHRGAINNTSRSVLLNPNYFKIEPFRREFTYPFLPPVVRSEQKFRWIASQIFRIDFLNRPTGFNRLLYDFFAVYLNPFRYIMKLEKVIKNKQSEFYS